MRKTTKVILGIAAAALVSFVICVIVTAQPIIGTCDSYRDVPLVGADLVDLKSKYKVNFYQSRWFPQLDAKGRISEADFVAFSDKANLNLVRKKAIDYAPYALHPDFDPPQGKSALAALWTAPRSHAIVLLVFVPPRNATDEGDLYLNFNFRN